MIATQVVLVSLLGFTAVTGFIDFRTGHIPNRLVAFGAAFGIALHFYVHLRWLQLPDQSTARLLAHATANVLLGVLSCAVVPLLLYRLSAMGGGDVKLLACVGAWGGPVLGLQVELYAFVVAAIYAPAQLAYRGQLFKSLGNSLVLIKNPFLPKAKRRALPAALLTELRFGPAIFFATAAVALVRWGHG